MSQSSTPVVPTAALPGVLQTAYNARRPQPLEPQCENDVAVATNAAIEYLTEAFNGTLTEQERLWNTKPEPQPAALDQASGQSARESNGTCAGGEHGNHFDGFVVATSTSRCGLDASPTFCLEKKTSVKNAGAVHSLHEEGVTAGPTTSDDRSESIEVHRRLSRLANACLSRCLPLSFGADSNTEEADNHVPHTYSISSNLQQATLVAGPNGPECPRCSEEDGGPTSRAAADSTDVAVLASLAQIPAARDAAVVESQSQRPATRADSGGKSTDTRDATKGSSQGCEGKEHRSSTGGRRPMWPLPYDAEKGKSKIAITYRRKTRKKSTKREVSAANQCHSVVMVEQPGSGCREQGQEDGKCSAEESIPYAGAHNLHWNTCAQWRHPVQGATCGRRERWRPRSHPPLTQNVRPLSHSPATAEPSGFDFANVTSLSNGKANTDAAHGYFASVARYASMTMMQTRESLQERQRRDSNCRQGNINTSNNAAPDGWNAVLQQLSRTSDETSTSLTSYRNRNRLRSCVSVAPRTGTEGSPASESNVRLRPDTGTLPRSAAQSPEDSDARPCPTWVAPPTDKSYSAQAALASSMVAGCFPQDRTFSEQAHQPLQHGNLLDAVEQLAEDLKVLITATRCEARGAESTTIAADSSNDQNNATNSAKVSLHQSYWINPPSPQPAVLGCGAFQEPGMTSDSFSHPLPSAPSTPNTVGSKTSPREALQMHFKSGFGSDTFVGAITTTCESVSSRSNESRHIGAPTSNPPGRNNAQRHGFQELASTGLPHSHCYAHCDEQRLEDQHLEFSKENEGISAYSKFQPCKPGSVGVRRASGIPSPPPPPPLPSPWNDSVCGEGRNSYVACELHPLYALPRYELGMVHNNQSKGRHSEEQQQHGSAVIRYTLKPEGRPGRVGGSTSKGVLTAGSSSIPRGLSGSNSGMLWTTDVPPVSLLLTLPLNIPYGVILKFGSPDVLPHTNLSLPALHPAPVGINGKSPGRGPSPAGNEYFHQQVPRVPGAKKSYYCFSPQLHPGAHTLLSHAGGICDTFAASLHVELAICYVPVPLLSTVASIFQALAPRLPHLASPLKLNCGGLNERNAPGRFGGKVLTVSCAASEHEERRKFQQMQDFLSVFQSKVDALLCEYTDRLEKLLGGGHTGGGRSHRGVTGRGSAPGKKHNIWKYSMTCLPTSLNIPAHQHNSGKFQGRSENSPGGGSSDHYAAAGCSGEEGDILNGCPKELGGGGALDLTVRAFESKPLDEELKEYARGLVVPDVYVSEMRLITTHSLPGRTCELDPRFPDYCIGTRPIVLGPDGTLCRHTLTDTTALPDIWEVRLRSGESRDLQKQLVQRCIVAAVENRPRHERDALLKAVVDAGATLWMNGRILLTPPPLLSTGSCPTAPRQEENLDSCFKEETSQTERSMALCSSGVSSGRCVGTEGRGLRMPALVDRRPTPVASPALSVNHRHARGVCPPRTTERNVLRCSSTAKVSSDAHCRRLPSVLRCETGNKQHACSEEVCYDGKISKDPDENKTSWEMREGGLSRGGHFAAMPIAGFANKEVAPYREDRGWQNYVNRGGTNVDRASAGVEGFSTVGTLPPPGFDLPLRERALRTPALGSADVQEPAHSLWTRTTEETGVQQKHLKEMLALLRTLASCWNHRPGISPPTGEPNTLQEDVESGAPWNCEGVAHNRRFDDGTTELDGTPDATHSVHRQLLCLAGPVQCRVQPPERHGRDDTERRRGDSGKTARISSRSSVATCDSSDSSPAAAAAVKGIISRIAHDTVSRPKILDPFEDVRSTNSGQTRNCVAASHAGTRQQAAVPTGCLDISQCASSPSLFGTSTLFVDSSFNSGSDTRCSRTKAVAGEVATAVADETACNKAVQGDAPLPLPAVPEPSSSDLFSKGPNALSNAPVIDGQPHCTGSNAGLFHTIQSPQVQEPCQAPLQREVTVEPLVRETQGNDGDVIREQAVPNCMQYS